MKRQHPLSGLMAFVGRGEWRDVFGQLLGEHLGLTLDAFGLTTETLIQVLGKDRAAKLWGCVLEDLMARHSGPGLRNVVDDYLEGDGQAEPSLNSAYMLAVRQSVMSLYEVIGVTPEKGFVVQDAIRDLGPVPVFQQERTWTLTTGDWVAARIIPDGDAYSITGSLLALTAQSADSLLIEMRSIQAEFGRQTSGAMVDHQLRLCTSVFTQAWLLDNLPASFDAPSAAGRY